MRPTGSWPPPIPAWYCPGPAASLSNLGIWFSELGRPVEALPVAEEAVAIYRELAAAYPDRYRPELATSLSNLGLRLFDPRTMAG